AMRGRLVENGIGVLAGWDASDHGKGLQLEDDDRVGAAGADVAAPQIVRERDTVDPRRVADLAGQDELAAVHDLDLRAMRHEYPRAGGVKSQIVPALVPREGNLVCQVVARRGIGSDRSRTDQCGATGQRQANVP